MCWRMWRGNKKPPKRFQTADKARKRKNADRIKTIGWHFAYCAGSVWKSVDLKEACVPFKVFYAVNRKPFTLPQ